MLENGQKRRTMTAIQGIETIESLVNELQDADPDDYEDLAKQLCIDPSDAIEYATWSEDKYTRNCLAHTEEFELILLCWEKGQSTPIHDHNDQECWVHVVEGTFCEGRYIDSENGMEELGEFDLLDEGLSYMNDNMGYHRLSNSTDGRAMTLHLYAKPIQSCKIFNEDTNQFMKVDLCYDTVHDILNNTRI